MCAEFELSISPLRLGVEKDVYACLIAFTQIENTANHIDARTTFPNFNPLVLNLMTRKRFQIWRIKVLTCRSWALLMKKGSCQSELVVVLISM